MGTRKKEKLKVNFDRRVPLIELWQNNATGELFICVDDDQYKMTLVTQTGEIKKFGYDDFDGPHFQHSPLFQKGKIVSQSFNYLLAEGLITQQQMDKFKAYVDLNKEEYLEGLFNRFQMWHWETWRCRIIRKGS